MTEAIRAGKQVELADYGKEEKTLQEGEAVFRPVFRKSLVAGRDLSEGTALMPEMIYAMRPQKFIDGLPSGEYEEVLGKKLKNPLKKYAPIKAENLI